MYRICPLQKIVGMGKERRTSIGKNQTFSLDLSMFRADFLEPADSGQAVNAIATQLRHPIYSGLTRWR